MAGTYPAHFVSKSSGREIIPGRVSWIDQPARFAEPSYLMAGGRFDRRTIMEAAHAVVAYRRACQDALGLREGFDPVRRSYAVDYAKALRDIWDNAKAEARRKPWLSYDKAS